ncbi:MAG: hypothetical protein K5649_08565, partial [Lachnospiraceae bacterium]|nr:hypothetical protein [Lachnospiraceae bacterium]
CDHIYLTTSYRKARAYAEAFGICGEVFYVADGIERIVSEMNPEDATPSEEVTGAVNHIRRIREENYAPVVLCYQNVVMSDLKGTEFGFYEHPEAMVRSILENGYEHPDFERNITFRMRDDFPLKAGSKIEDPKGDLTDIRNAAIECFLEKKKELLPDLIIDIAKEEFPQYLAGLSDDEVREMAEEGADYFLPVRFEKGGE